MHLRSSLAAAAAVVVSSVSFAAPALGAGGLPTGKYYCRYYDESTMGVIKVTSTSAYTYNGAKRGTY
jgi:hypothetical protein